MVLPPYLAMTAAEIAGCETMPERIAWMACHFSSYGLGLSNIPRQLPEKSLLILNDRTPVSGHDPELVARQLAELAENFSVSAVLLDFQRPGCSETAAVTAAAAKLLPCPVGVTRHYADAADCGVFLDAPRPYHPLRLEQWQGRELWLEVSFSPCTVTVTKEGSRCDPGADFPEELPIHRDEKLFCHYAVQKRDDKVTFFLHRTAEDLQALLAAAEHLGITRAIGLYQELGKTLA